MSKVFLVHSESGEYSDWSFVPLAVFTTRKKAVEWIEGQSVGLHRYEWSTAPLGIAESWQEPTAYGHPSTTDSKTWSVTASEDGEPVNNFDELTWFIDELDLDPVREETE